MRIIAKSSFYDNNGLHVKNEVVEIETSAFNPAYMVESPEAKTEKKSAVEKITKTAKKNKKE